MKKIAFMTLALATVYAAPVPAFAQDSQALCKLMATYRPGVDAQGNPVVPADINAAVSQNDVVKIPVTVDLAKSLTQNLPAGTEMDAAVSMIEIHKDGKVLYNGQDVTGRATAICGSAPAQAADAAPADLTAPVDEPAAADIVAPAPAPAPAPVAEEAAPAEPAKPRYTAQQRKEDHDATVAAEAAARAAVAGGAATMGSTPPADAAEPAPAAAAPAAETGTVDRAASATGDAPPNDIQASDAQAIGERAASQAGADLGDTVKAASDSDAASSATVTTSAPPATTDIAAPPADTPAPATDSAPAPADGAAAQPVPASEAGQQGGDTIIWGEGN
jgi:hypothetical protein